MRDGVATPRPFRFPPDRRVKVRADFVRMNESAKRVHTPHFVIQVGAPGRCRREAPSGLNRLGITVTRKVANSVGRNRVKRVVREVFRQHPEFFPEAVDLVFVARANATELGFDAAVAELAKVRPALASAAERVRRGASS